MSADSAHELSPHLGDRNLQARACGLLRGTASLLRGRMNANGAWAAAIAWARPWRIGHLASATSARRDRGDAGCRMARSCGRRLNIKVSRRGSCGRGGKAAAGEPWVGRLCRGRCLPRQSLFSRRVRRRSTWNTSEAIPSQRRNPSAWTSERSPGRGFRAARIGFQRVRPPRRRRTRGIGPLVRENPGWRREAARPDEPPAS